MPKFDDAAWTGPTAPKYTLPRAMALNWYSSAAGTSSLVATGAFANSFLSGWKSFDRLVEEETPGIESARKFDPKPVPALPLGP